jgi:hypothetical protein
MMRGEMSPRSTLRHSNRVLLLPPLLYEVLMFLRPLAVLTDPADGRTCILLPPYPQECGLL